MQLQISIHMLLNKSPTFRMDEMVSPLASVEDSFFSASSLRPTRKSKTVPCRADEETRDRASAG